MNLHTQTQSHTHVHTHHAPPPNTQKFLFCFVLFNYTGQLEGRSKQMAGFQVSQAQVIPYVYINGAGEMVQYALLLHMTRGQLPMPMHIP